MAVESPYLEFCNTLLLLGATENKQILDETDLKRVILDLEGQVG